MLNYKNRTLEDILQRNFKLNGPLYKSDGMFTTKGNNAYLRFIRMLGDLSSHVSTHIDKELGAKIMQLIDVFDGYEGGGTE